MCFVFFFFENCLREVFVSEAEDLLFFFFPLYYAQAVTDKTAYPLSMENTKLCDYRNKNLSFCVNNR